jgi:hypothetical protein
MSEVKALWSGGVIVITITRDSEDIRIITIQGGCAHVERMARFGQAAWKPLSPSADWWSKIVGEIISGMPHRAVEKEKEAE